MYVPVMSHIQTHSHTHTHLSSVPKRYPHHSYKWMGHGTHQKTVMSHIHTCHALIAHTNENVMSHTHTHTHTYTHTPQRRPKRTHPHCPYEQMRHVTPKTTVMLHNHTHTPDSPSLLPPMNESCHSPNDCRVTHTHTHTHTHLSGVPRGHTLMTNRHECVISHTHKILNTHE